jgi:hypothetical protein
MLMYVIDVHILSPVAWNYLNNRMVLKASALIFHGMVLA